MAWSVFNANCIHDTADRLLINARTKKKHPIIHSSIMDANVHNIRSSMSRFQAFCDEMKFSLSTCSSHWNHFVFLLSLTYQHHLPPRNSLWLDLQSACFVLIKQILWYKCRSGKRDQFMASEMLCKEGRQCRPLFIGCALVPLPPLLLCLWSLSCLVTWIVEQPRKRKYVIAGNWSG